MPSGRRAHFPVGSRLIRGEQGTDVALTDIEVAVPSPSGRLRPQERKANAAGGPKGERQDVARQVARSAG